MLWGWIGGSVGGWVASVAVVAEPFAIRTDRLDLRAFQPADLAPLQALLGDARVVRQLFDGRPKSPEEVRALVDAEFSFGRAPLGLAVLELRATSEVVGFGGLIPCAYLDEGEVELGFAFAERAWGKGYATEIGQGQIDYALGPLGLSRVHGLAHPDNAASLAVLRRIGMRESATVQAGTRGPRVVMTIERMVRSGGTMAG